MEIKVDCCGKCPFCVVEYDTECVGDDTLLYCNLSSFLNKKQSIIDSFDSWKTDDVENDDNSDIEYVRPEFCPLNDTNIKITIN